MDYCAIGMSNSMNTRFKKYHLRFQASVSKAELPVLAVVLMCEGRGSLGPSSSLFNKVLMCWKE